MHPQAREDTTDKGMERRGEYFKMFEYFIYDYF
jgi:hypothetical protein